MKICANCGAEIEEKSNFCPHCGTKCEIGKDVEKPAFIIPENEQGERNETNAPTDAHPMKWHNFLMIIMILGGFVTIAYGMRMMTGTEYVSNGLNSNKVYGTFPGLKNCDIFYGVALIALGIFEFVVRSRLNKFRENGPRSLKIMYILSLVANVIYLFWASSATSINMFNSSNIGSMGSSVLLLIINSIYYSKRSELFVN